MLQPNFKVTTKDTGVNAAQIIIEPLPQNFGHTLGNSLRRILLTSLEGGSATSIKIDGVPHQFSTLSGLREDILDLILNLKTVNFAIDTDEIKNVKLHVSGEKEIKASDLDCPTGVTVTNPDKVLCHLTSPKAKINAVITVARGMGYVPAEEHTSEEIGVIPLDSSFSPVISASYTIEATRVGRSTAFDKIKLQLVTDGSITPLDAFKEASRLLTDYSAYVNSEEAYLIEVKPKASTLATGGYVDDLDLPTRVLNALKKADIVKLSDLKSLSLSDLHKVKNLGEKSAAQVVEKAAEKGITIA